MVLAGKRVMRHVACTTERRGVLSQGTTALVLLAVVACAAATDAIGVHALFGAFALGVIVPHDSLLAKSLIHKLSDFVVILFLPAYFAYTGLRTEIGLVSTAQEWMLCGLIVLVAFAGKLGGVSLAARLTGLPWRTSTALGILMNTRGLMQLVVLNIGYDLGLISPALFAMMVIMALVTTLATTPVFDALTRGSPLVMPAPDEKRAVGDAATRS
jgi:Kef-type K+ transport system membrane component KefB